MFCFMFCQNKNMHNHVSSNLMHVIKLATTICYQKDVATKSPNQNKKKNYLYFLFAMKCHLTYSPLPILAIFITSVDCEPLSICNHPNIDIVVVKFQHMQLLKWHLHGCIQLMQMTCMYTIRGLKLQTYVRWAWTYSHQPIPTYKQQRQGNKHNNVKDINHVVLF